MDVIGFFFDGPELKAVRMRGHEVIDRNVKQLYIPNTRLAGAVPTVVRSLELPVSSPRKALQGLPFQIESLSHVPVNELVYATQLSRVSKHTAAHLFFTRKNTLQTVLSLNPDFLFPASAALVSYARYRWPDIHEAILVTQNSCTWMENGKVKKSFTTENNAPLDPVIETFQTTGKKTVIHLDAEEPLALAIGAALHSLDPKPLQLLTGPLTPRKQLSSAGKTIAATFAAALGASAVLLGLGGAQHERRRAFLESQTLEKCSPAPTTLPYLLQVPTVTETLSWLSHHPLSNTFHLLDIRYRLTPDQDAIIDLTLQIHNPTLARQFHDTLLQDPFLDPTHEITWSSSDNQYRTSFHLKHRPPHVF